MRFDGIPFGLVERQTAGAVRQGLSLERLLDESLIVRRYGDDRDVISPTQYLLLCLNTSLGVQDASHGLAKVGLGPSYPAIGLRMTMGYPRLGDALSALCRFYSMASSDMHFALTGEHAHATFSITMDAWTERDAAQIEEIQLGWLFMNCMNFLGYPPPVSQVVVRDPTHFNMGGRHWAIGGLVRHGATTAFSFPRRLLAEPPAANHGTVVFWECHRRWLEFVGDTMPVPDLSAYVTDAGFVRFADIVRESGRSANTVRQRLQSSSSGNFRDARQRALADAAAVRLCASAESVDAVAAECGYSDARSFRRFVKAATGLTPQQIRQRGNLTESHVEARAFAKLRSLSERLNI